MCDYTKIKTIEETDRMLEDLWAELEDIPMDPETECMEAPFLDFPAGTDREDIWHWFDERYSRGVAALMSQDGVDRTDEIAKFTLLHCYCDECDSRDCCYNHDGECRFAMVHERKPHITEEDGCVDFEIKEEI